MGWFNILLASAVVGAPAPADPLDVTIVNGAWRDARTAIRSGADNPAVLQSAQISEEIRRRQIALIARDVATVRAR